MSNLALKLIDGTKQDRDQYINHTNILDKVKELVMLPDNKYIQSSEVANFFEVSPDVIRRAKNRHNEEFLLDGIKTIKGVDLKKYKEKIQSGHNVTIKTNSQLTLYTRQSVLRMGMLLTESKIAEKVRDYLLIVEKLSTQEQKQQALKFTGEWIPELDTYLLNEVSNGIDNGIGLVKTIEKVADKLSTTKSKVQARWYGNKSVMGLKELLTDEQRNRIKNNSNTIMMNKISEQNSNVTIRTNLDSAMIIKYLTKQDNYYNSQNKELTILKEQNKLLLQRNAEYKYTVDIQNESLNDLKEIINSNQNINKELLNELQNLKEQSHKEHAKLWRQNEEFKENQNKLIEDIITLKEQIDFIADKVDLSIDEEYNSLKKRIKSLNNKLINSQTEYDDLLKRIGRSTVMNGIFVDKESVSGTSFKMDRNGNLTKM